MRNFVVRHPFFAIHVYGLAIGFAGAAAGLNMHGIIWLGFAAGIPYSIVTNRWEEAAARDRKAQNAALSANAQRRGHTAEPIHPR
jgi:hypothetical protein